MSGYKHLVKAVDFMTEDPIELVRARTQMAEYARERAGQRLALEQRIGAMRAQWGDSGRKVRPALLLGSIELRLLGESSYLETPPPSTTGPAVARYYGMDVLHIHTGSYVALAELAPEVLT